MLTADNRLKDNEVDRVAYYLLHAEAATRDELFLRLLYHAHPKTVYKIRCAYGAEEWRMHLQLAQRTQAVLVREGEAPQSQGVIACSDKPTGLVHG